MVQRESKLKQTHGHKFHFIRIYNEVNCAINVGDSKVDGKKSDSFSQILHKEKQLII